MKTLKQLAAEIKVEFHRIGFNPLTEQTDFIAVINGQRFNFHTGLFACIPEKKKMPSANDRGFKEVKPLEHLAQRYKALHHVNNMDRILLKIRQGLVKAEKNLQCREVMQVFEDISKLATPTAYDFLYCIQSDCRAEGQSFSDWCSEFGYNNDSIKDLNTYNQCVDEAKRLRTALGPDLFRQLMEAQDE